MTKIFAKTGLAAAALTASALVFPTMASANSGHYYGNDRHYGYDAHEACKRDEKKDKVTGAVVGALIGGIVGANVAADGVQGEGAVLGASIGSIAGAGIADKQTDCDPQYGYYDNGYNRGTVYGDGTYRQNSYYGQDRYQRTQPRVVYQNPRPVYNQGYYGTQTGTYRTNSYYPARTYPARPHYRKAVKRHRKDLRKAYRQGYRQGKAHNHYHGQHICYGRH